MIDKRVLPPDLSDGPWKITSRTSPGWRVEDKDNKLICFSSDNPYDAPNAEFIVWARNNIEDILFENDRLRKQNNRIRLQTRHIRKIYEVLIDIERWLEASNQPDTYIGEFKKLVDESGIFRESQL